jgi:predicted 2-oxoglutarate/Fe(II)-dependent dioxygenase YbiX
VEYDANGFARGFPLSPDRWRVVCPNDPPGQVVTHGEAPPGILILKNYLGKAVCARLRTECDFLQGTPGTTEPTSSSGERRVATDDTRICDMIEHTAIKTDLVSLVGELWMRFIGPHYQAVVDAFEAPHVLRYRRGGLYRPHADAENWDPGRKIWVRQMDRDLSLLLYFNEDFTQGELVFPNFGFVLPPRAGMAVAFPSDHRYMHAAREVAEGVRYAIVSWATVRGSSRVEKERRPNVIPVELV